MSDMMQGALPQGAPPPGARQDVKAKMSVFNPTDMAAKISKGDICPQQTVGEFLQRNFGVSPQDPVEKLFANIKGQAKNATMAGKMGMPSPRPGQGAPAPAPQAGPPMPQGQPIRSMDDLAQRI